jgi:starch-binding outer membrane protein, SusD/RagB family
MKKFIIPIISFAIILIFTSCEEFLEENPKNQIVVDDYFNNPEDIRSLVNGIYSTGALIRYNAGDWQRECMLGPMLSGLFENEGPVRVGPDEANSLTLNSLNMDEYMANWWDRGYSSIARSNTAIKYIPEMSELSTSEANQLMAEAKFFRAFNYFFLLRDFGDVPLILEPYETLENVYVSRDPTEQVYDQIISDLKWALDNGDLADLPYWMNGYRITEGIVATTLADVYLHRAGYPVQKGAQDYANAANVARLVINNGQYQLIEHGNTLEESAYNVMRTSRNEREYIFCYEFDRTLRSTGIYPSYTIPMHIKLDDIKLSLTYLGFRPLPEFINIYDTDEDLRFQPKQFWHNKIIHKDKVYEFGDGVYAPYIWWDDVAIYETAKWGNDLRINTFAEVLLIAAESIARSEGVTDEAVTYLTDVRSRAYWKTERNQIKSELASLTDEKFIEEVWKERLRELPFLFKVWTDIQRTRKYPVTSSSNPGEVNFVNVVGAINPFGKTFEEKHLLYPIATRTQQSNPEITSNGY